MDKRVTPLAGAGADRPARTRRCLFAFDIAPGGKVLHGGIPFSPDTGFVLECRDATACFCFPKQTVNFKPIRNSVKSELFCIWEVDVLALGDQPAGRHGCIPAKTLRLVQPFTGKLGGALVSNGAVTWDPRGYEIEYADATTAPWGHAVASYRDAVDFGFDVYSDGSFVFRAKFFYVTKRLSHFRGSRGLPFPFHACSFSKEGKLVHASFYSELRNDALSISTTTRSHYKVIDHPYIYYCVVERDGDVLKKQFWPRDARSPFYTVTVNTKTGSTVGAWDPRSTWSSGVIPTWAQDVDARGESLLDFTTSFPKGVTTAPPTPEESVGDAKTSYDNILSFLRESLGDKVPRSPSLT